VSASQRRNACEQALRHARWSNWTTLHLFLDTEALAEGGRASIEGFSPTLSEAYFRQRTLSAFGAPGFGAKLESLAEAPTFLMSFAGLRAIGATFFDALGRDLSFYIVTDAVADVANAEASEEARLLAVETIARAHNRDVSCADLLALTSASPQAPIRRPLNNAVAADVPFP
jgi:hypothetical protein